MGRIKVAVCGACGKMGQEVVKAVIADPEMELVAKIDLVCVGENLYGNIEDAIRATDIDVLVDFTQPASIFKNAQTCLKHKVRPVIGTTGLKDEEIEELRKLAKANKTSCLIAPNFTTGAVLMMKFAQMAAKYFDNAEIIELHHNQKKDAPSGTAVKTAKMMSEANKSFATGNSAEEELITGSRGGVAECDIHIHSVRMPGYMASQEILFGAPGQILKIRHDSVDRTCYMPGVMMAVKQVMKNNEFIYGLENIL